MRRDDRKLRSPTSVATDERRVLIGCVDSLTLDRLNRDRDAVSMLQYPELLETFGFLQRRYRPRDELPKERRAVDIQPNVPECRRAGRSAAGAVSVERNRGA